MSSCYRVPQNTMYKYVIKSYLKHIESLSSGDIDLLIVVSVFEIIGPILCRSSSKDLTDILKNWKNLSG